ncbi:hypothetical protein HPB47_012103 [Ixodes persulcatus]|uniref:Uncharacterized protein n=1 Tax=Ixodes persulcatus TaxID=34615 RepID=A0AC60NUI3_IXOPE|nr:hypothetical protein HPB47_012103 [Ixodes persulcatus]
MLPGRWNEGGYGGPSGRRDYSRRWVRKPRRPGDLYEPPTDELSGAKLCLTLLFLLALGFTATEYYIQLLPLFREAYQKIHDKERVAEDANEPRAYNDRTGRIIEPHRAWMGFSEHWRSPYGALHVFSAFYMHGKDGTTKPHVKVTALLSPRLRHTCVVRARIVYLDYPHSFPTTTPSSAKRLMLEDCMFRSRSFVEFVALMNADELLVPRKNSSEAGRHRRFQLTGTLADVYLFERSADPVEPKREAPRVPPRHSSSAGDNRRTKTTSAVRVHFCLRSIGFIRS